MTKPLTATSHEDAPTTDLRGKTAVVTGGTDGIGAATALALCARGAHVFIIGRSPEKAARLTAQAQATGGGTLRAVVADLSLMKNVLEAVDNLAKSVERIDILVHAVGILLPRTEHTAEGIEKDFAVSYLARFAFLEEAKTRGLLGPSTQMINISASGPKIPSYAQLEFGSLDEVQKRVGMKSHGQAQLANDLLTAQSPERYGIQAIGYGPGSVRTQIRREVPGAIRTLMAPVFMFTTRSPEAVATQLVEILLDPDLPSDTASWFNKKGRFTPAAFVTDTGRQRDLLATSQALLRQAVSIG